MSSPFWQSIDQFALNQPILFSTAATVLLLLLLIAGILMGAALSKDVDVRRQIGEAIGRLLGAAILVFAVQRLGWLVPAGFQSAGTPQTWGLMAVATIYVVVAFPYSLTGSLTFRQQNPRLATSLALNAASAALIEEIAFRGIVLYALVRVWGGSQAGVLGAVIISSVFFSIIHVLNLLAGESIGRVAPQLVWSLLGGIFFAALVVRGGSIWSAVLLHASANIAVRLSIQSKPGFKPPTRAFITLAVLAIPLAVLGITML